MIECAEVNSEFKGHLELFQYFLDMVARLGVNGQSSDEEDTQIVDGVPYSRRLAKSYPWRSKEITRYLMMIDNLVADFCKQRGGRPAVQRVRGLRESADEPLAGLPVVMYDEDWLRKKDRENPYYRLYLLQPSDENMELLTVDTVAILEKNM